MPRQKKLKQEGEKTEPFWKTIRTSAIGFVVTQVAMPTLFGMNKTLTLAIIVASWRDNWILILTISVAVMIVVFIYNRVQTVRNQNNYEDFAELIKMRTSSDRILDENYLQYGVLWRIWYRSGVADPEEKCCCPNCGTALNEKATFWWRYKWECPRDSCKFTIKQKEPMMKIRRSVKAMATADLIDNVRPV